MGMKYYEKTKIGKLISAGSEHIVFEYGDDKVIKFSIVNFLIGNAKGTDRATRELALCKKYFGKYILDTELLLSTNHRHIAEVQPKVRQHYLTINDIKDPSIHKQFMEIVQNYDQLVSLEKIEIDLTGQAGLFKQCLGNIFITDKNRLVIIDSTLLRVSRPVWLMLFLAIIRVIVLPIQKRRIKKFINI
jgi:hypothetical protein